MSDQGNTKPLDLNYWMGAVDTRLLSLQESIGGLQKIIDKFVEGSKQEWSQFHAWRESTDRRLATGSEKFLELTTQIKHLQEHSAEDRQTIKDLRGELEQIKTRCINCPKSELPKNDLTEKFISWEYLRDKFGAPIILWLIIAIIAFVIGNQITLP